MRGTPPLMLRTDTILEDIQNLTDGETGAYFLLLMYAWHRPDNSLPDDDEALAQMAMCSPEEWTAIKAVVMEFWALDPRRKEWTLKHPHRVSEVWGR